MPLTPYPSQFFTRANATPIAGQTIPKGSVLTWAELDTSLLMLNQKINDTIGLNIGPVGSFGVYHSKTYAADNGTLNFYSLLAGSGITIVDTYTDATLTLSVVPSFCEAALTAATIPPCGDCGIKFQKAASGYTFPMYGPATTGQTLVLAPPAAQTGGCSNQLMWGTVSSSATVFTDLYVDSATWATDLGGHPTIINIHRSDGVQWNLNLSGETPYVFNENAPDYTAIRPRLGSNDAKAIYSNIAGGESNTISPSNTNASIGGGSGNTIEGSHRYDFARTSSYHSVILNGKDNLIASAATSVILGGKENRIGNVDAGAFNNPIGEDRVSNLIGAGTQNLISGASQSSIMGGTENKIQDITHSFIGGGYSNTITSGSTDAIKDGLPFNTRGFSSILGGWYNAISGQSASIVGGDNNKVQTTYGSILAGYNNNVNAIYGVILNASANTISPTASASTISAGVGLIAYSSETTYTRGLDAHTDITQALGGVVNTEHRPFRYHGNYASPGYGKFLMSNSNDGHAKWVSLPFIPSGITNVSGGCYMASAYTSGCTVYMTLTGGTLCQGAVITANTCSNLGPYQYGAGTNSIKPVLGTNTTVGDFSTVQGGLFNRAPGTFGSVVNGISNDIEGIHDFIGNGQENKIVNTSTGNYHRTILNGYSGHNASVRGGTILNGDANYLEDGAQWSTIINGKENRITGNVDAVTPGTSGGYNLIGNGSLHRIISGTTNSTILNGHHNQLISANTVSILGGRHNAISGESNTSVIVAGQHNLINSPMVDIGSTSGVFIGAGHQNMVISGVTSGIVGGTENYISGATSSFIGGGTNNKITQQDGATTGRTKISSIVGGDSNLISGEGEYNFIGGGYYNDIRSVSNSLIVGGHSNSISQDNSVDTIDIGFKSILGGHTNYVQGTGYDVILGGSGNTITADSNGNFGLIGNGRDNQLITAHEYSTILNGQKHEVTSIYGSILGGSGNTVNGNFGHIVGGTGNTINATATSSAIIGCNDLTADQSNTTYMCGLTAGTISATTVFAWNVPQKYVDTRNYTANVAETITHNLDTQDVVVNIWDTATSQRVDATIQYGTLNTLTVELTMNKDNIKTVIIG